MKDGFYIDRDGIDGGEGYPEDQDMGDMGDMDYQDGRDMGDMGYTEEYPEDQDMGDMGNMEYPENQQEQIPLSKKEQKRLEKQRAKQDKKVKADKKQKPDKKSKHQQLGNEAIESETPTPSTNVETEKPDTVLYIISDKPIPGLLSYMRSFGINVTAVFNQVDLARGYLLMQPMPTRVVIVDSGTGKFMTTSIRKELIDMIGVNGEDSKFTIFYSDSALKSDAMAALGKAGKSVEWIKYSSTAVIVASLSLHHENYVIDKDTAMDDGGIDDSILQYVGDKIDNDLTDSIGSPIINSDLILKNVVNSVDDGLRGFEPHI